MRRAQDLKGGDDTFFYKTITLYNRLAGYPLRSVIVSGSCSLINILLGRTEMRTLERKDRQLIQTV